MLEGVSISSSYRGREDTVNNCKQLQRISDKGLAFKVYRRTYYVHASVHGGAEPGTGWTIGGAAGTGWATGGDAPCAGWTAHQWSMRMKEECWAARDWAWHGCWKAFQHCLATEDESTHQMTASLGSYIQSLQTCVLHARSYPVVSKHSVPLEALTIALLTNPGEGGSSKSFGI